MMAAAIGLVVNAEGLGEAEVENLHRARGRDLDVRGLEIAMDNAVLVRGVERVGDLTREGKGLRDGQRYAESFGQRVALDELEHQRGHAGLLFKAVDGSDVRMVEGRERPRLALETHQSAWIFARGLRKDLDRHVAQELRISCAIHLAHAPGAESGLNLVLTEARSCRERRHRACQAGLTHRFYRVTCGRAERGRTGAGRPLRRGSESSSPFPSPRPSSI
jgi:hypothetical protein